MKWAHGQDCRCPECGRVLVVDRIYGAEVPLHFKAGRPPQQGWPRCPGSGTPLDAAEEES